MGVWPTYHYFVSKIEPMLVKEIILKIIRRKEFQGIWEILFHLSKIGMNFWGGSNINSGGEIWVLKYIMDKLGDKLIVVFDVGANMGEYTLATLNIAKNNNIVIYAFEPSSETFSSLEKNLQQLNLKEREKVKIFPIGFGANKQEVNLYSSGHGSSLASVYRLENPIAPFEDDYTEIIFLNTIDEFCQENNIAEIDFLKIDIEGHEMAALSGAMSMIKYKKIKFIQFEFGECHIDSKTFFRDFYNLLNKDYKLYRVLPNGLREIFKYSTDLEVFGTINYLAELR